MALLDEANIIRQNRKTIKVVIDNSGKINIFSPRNLSYSKIEEILQPKINLIRKKASQIQFNYQKNKNIINYNKVLILGKEYEISISDKIKKPCFSNEILFLPTKYYEADKVGFILKKTIFNIAKTVLINRVENIISNQTALVPKNILIGSFKSKWGSCDNLRIIKLNWKLVMLPENLINFVIYHELAHLKELNHSEKFYKILNQFEPNHRMLRKQLKDFNYLLNLY